MSTLNVIRPEDGWLPVRLPAGDYLHVIVNRNSCTIDLYVTESDERPYGWECMEIAGIPADHFATDVADFVRAALKDPTKPKLEVLP